MKWDTDLYDKNHDFVSKYGEELLTLLAPRAGEHILDIGCGTGDLAEAINRSGASVTGIDNAEEMILRAREKYPHIHFDVKSADDFSYTTRFDAVFSNATLHWVLNYEQAVKSIHTALKENGRFVAEFGAKDNVNNIITALKNALSKKHFHSLAAKQVWYFPSLAQYASVLEKYGFRVLYAAHFNRATLLKTGDGISNWLKMFAGPYLDELPFDIQQEIIHEVESQVRSTNFKDNNWYADYVRLRLLAAKQ